MVTEPIDDVAEHLGDVVTIPLIHGSNGKKKCWSCDQRADYGVTYNGDPRPVTACRTHLNGWQWAKAHRIATRKGQQ